MLKKLQKKYGVVASKLSDKKAFDLGMSLSGWRNTSFGGKSVQFSLDGGVLHIEANSSAFESLLDALSDWGYAGLEVTRVNPSGAGTEETVTVK